MRRRGRGHDMDGQALLETALTFPLHVLVVLGVLQAGLLSIGKAFTEYAAFAAARAALPEPEPGSPRARRPDPRQAAAIAVLPAVPSPTGALARLAGGAGILADPGRIAAARASVRVETRRAPGRVTARVAHDFALVVPVVNRLFAGGARILSGRARPVLSLPPEMPRLRLEGECTLPR